MYATALALAILLAQGTPQWFTGTWTAEFGGRTFVRVELEEGGGKPGGRMGIGNIEVHPDGTLRKVAPVPAQLSAILMPYQMMPCCRSREKPGTTPTGSSYAGLATTASCH
jgi:hypothetical protein